MKKLVLLAVLLVMATCISTSAFAWDASDLVLDDYYWLKYNGFVGNTQSYYTTYNTYRAGALNLLVDDASEVSTGVYARDISDNVWLGDLNVFCIDFDKPMSTAEYAAKYMNMNTTKGVAYLLSTYGAKNNDFAWNAALQAAVWKAIDPTKDFQIFQVSGPGADLDEAQTYYTRFVGEISNLSGYGTIPGFNGNDPLNKVSQNVGVTPVPEASTMVGFGSALLMAGPGMIGWIRRRRS